MQNLSHWTYVLMWYGTNTVMTFGFLTAYSWGKIWIYNLYLCLPIDTILNVSQMDITEEDELEESKLRSGRAFKRKSSPDRLEVSGPKRRSGKSPEHVSTTYTSVRYMSHPTLYLPYLVTKKTFMKQRKLLLSTSFQPQVKTQVTYEYSTTGEMLRKVQAEVEVKPPRSTRSSGRLFTVLGLWNCDVLLKSRYRRNIVCICFNF